MSRVVVQHAICIHRIAKLVSGLKVFPFIRIAVFSRWFLPSCLFYLSPCRSALPPPLVLSRHAAARSHCLLFLPLRYNASHCSRTLSHSRPLALPLSHSHAVPVFRPRTAPSRYAPAYPPALQHAPLSCSTTLVAMNTKPRSHLTRCCVRATAMCKRRYRLIRLLPTTLTHSPGLPLRSAPALRRYCHGL